MSLKKYANKLEKIREQMEADYEKALEKLSEFEIAGIYEGKKQEKAFEKADELENALAELESLISGWD